MSYTTLSSLILIPRPHEFNIVVSGHSHKPSHTERSGVTYLNPGSAGPRRFQLPITVARLDLRQLPWNVEFIDLSDGDREAITPVKPLSKSTFR
jgi:predicted phosphodiesterase